MTDSRNVIFAFQNACLADPVIAASGSTNTIGAGSKTFAVPGGTRFYQGGTVTAYDAANAANWMRGPITAFQPGGSVTFNSTSQGGSGTGLTSWVLVLDKFTQGSWSASMPLSNLGDKRLFMVARSSDGLVSSTRGRIDFGQSTLIQVLALLGGNLSQAAAWRLRLFDLAATTGLVTMVYDTGRRDISAPDVVWGSLAWGVLPWTGRTPVPQNLRAPPLHFTQAMVSLRSASLHTLGTGVKTFVMDGPTTDLQLGQPVSISRQADELASMVGPIQGKTLNTVDVRVTDFDGSGSYTDWTLRGLLQDGQGNPGPRQAYSARFFQFDLWNNGATVDIGGAFAAPILQNSRNAANGMQIDPQDESPRSRARGGQLYVDQRRQYRRFTLSIPYLRRDEMFAGLYEATRAAGLSTPFLMMLDPSDTTNFSRLAAYVAQAEPARFAHQNALFWTVQMVLEDYL